MRKENKVDIFIKWLFRNKPVLNIIKSYIRERILEKKNNLINDIDKILKSRTKDAEYLLNIKIEAHVETEEFSLLQNEVQEKGYIFKEDTIWGSHTF